MIVEPDFLDHWKTRLLVRLLGTEAAPVHVLRLWAHCQARKTDRFTGWKPDVLASVCRWDGDAGKLWSAMLETFCRMEAEVLVVHDWANCNKALISAWNNGKSGGRPAGKKPTGNRPVNPPETGRVTDRVDRVDRVDGEEKTALPRTMGADAPRVRFEKPTLQEIKSESDKIGLPANQADQFFSYYEANGWKVGRNPMKSWTHALANWKSRCNEFQRPNRQVAPPKGERKEIVEPFVFKEI